MAHMHGTWAHHVRPGHTDPRRYGTEEATGLARRRKRRGGGQPGSCSPKPDEFRVWDEEGRLVYHCAERKSAPVRELMARELPAAAVAEVEGGVRLRAGLRELGFASACDFGHWCAHGGTHEKGWRPPA